MTIKSLHENTLIQMQKPCKLNNWPLYCWDD